MHQRKKVIYGINDYFDRKRWYTGNGFSFSKSDALIVDEGSPEAQEAWWEVYKTKYTDDQLISEEVEDYDEIVIDPDGTVHQVHGSYRQWLYGW